jgi:hypothetical protein
MCSWQLKIPIHKTRCTQKPKGISESLFTHPFLRNMREQCTTLRLEILWRKRPLEICFKLNAVGRQYRILECLRWSQLRGGQVALWSGWYCLEHLLFWTHVSGRQCARCPSAILFRWLSKKLILKLIVYTSESLVMFLRRPFPVLRPCSKTHLKWPTKVRLTLTCWNCDFQKRLVSCCCWTVICELVPPICILEFSSGGMGTSGCGRTFH